MVQPFLAPPPNSIKVFNRVKVIGCKVQRPFGPNLIWPKCHWAQSLFIARANDCRHSTSNLQSICKNFTIEEVILQSWFHLFPGFCTVGTGIWSDGYKFKPTQMLCLSSELCVSSFWKNISSFILWNGNVPLIEWTNSTYFMVQFITMENEQCHCLKMQNLFHFSGPNCPIIEENRRVGQKRTKNTRMAWLKVETQFIPNFTKTIEQLLLCFSIPRLFRNMCICTEKKYL